jgi:tight adherence protein B
MISLLAFVGVAALVGGLAMLLRRGDAKVEDRLSTLTGTFPTVGGKASGKEADTSLTPTKFCLISGAMGVAGLGVGLVSGLHVGAAPLMALMTGALPLVWLVLRRRKRLRQFAAQLPDALELISRALRAGHSLAAGFNLAASEMQAPLATEFSRVYEEQNLGIPLDDALRNLTERVPNLDLKFFSTAVILQRQTGGDLAEILDKIGHLVRERFQIWGQVQALTGEGRLSGVVLLGLPPVLFVVMYRLNPDYVMMLFTDPMGKQMLAGAIVMQILGALVIRKIVNIKV